MILKPSALIELRAVASRSSGVLDYYDPGDYTARIQPKARMQKPTWEMDKLFPILCRFLDEAQTRTGDRLISSGEIARRLPNDNEAEAMINAAKQQLPGLTFEQLAGDIVGSFGQGVARAGSEWQSLVAAVQIGDEWFFRLKPQKIASAAYR